MIYSLQIIGHSQVLDFQIYLCVLLYFGPSIDTILESVLSVWLIFFALLQAFCTVKNTHELGGRI